MRVFAMSVGKFFMRRFIFGVFTLPVSLLIFYRSGMALFGLSASLREIPEVASVRKPPLKRKSAATTDTNARE